MLILAPKIKIETNCSIIDKDRSVPKKTITLSGLGPETIHNEGVKRASDVVSDVLNNSSITVITITIITLANILQHLLCSKHCFKYIACINSLHSHSSLGQYYYLYFADEGSETQPNNLPKAMQLVNWETEI